jgi:hypothetical protein
MPTGKAKPFPSIKVSNEVGIVPDFLCSFGVKGENATKSKREVKKGNGAWLI